MKYYKIKYGYGDLDYCEITDQELPKAYGMFLTQEGNGIFSDGFALRARDIIRIEPNWHKVRGWVKGWPMTIDDYEDIKPLERSYQDTLNEAKEITELAIKKEKTEILTKPMDEIKKIIGYVERKELSPELKKISSEIASKFKI